MQKKPHYYYLLSHISVASGKMAKVIQPPPKFTHPEWRVSNQSKYANAEAERIAAERLIAESDRLKDETDQTTARTQADVNKKFGELDTNNQQQMGVRGLAKLKKFKKSPQKKPDRTHPKPSYPDMDRPLT